MRALPEAPPGSPEELTNLVSILMGEVAEDEYRAESPVVLEHLTPVLNRIAQTTLAKAKRASVGTGPALEAIQKALGALKELEMRMNAVPEPLSGVVLALLRRARFQDDALLLLRRALETTDAHTRGLLGIGPTDPPPSGRNDLASRLTGDALDYVIGESIALFATFRPTKLRPSPEGPLAGFIASFWTYATGYDSDPPSLPRRLSRALHRKANKSPA